MNTDFAILPPATRVWIYQGDRLLTGDEAAMAEQAARRFAADWTAHNRSLRASAAVLHNLFLVLAVDESQAGASGCSIDASVHFVRELQRQLGLSFLDKMHVAFREGDAVRVCPVDDLAEKYRRGLVTDDTPVFNNLVATKGELLTGWEIPLANSWVMQRVNG